MITLHGDDQQYKIHWVRYLEECRSANMPSQPGIGFYVGVAVKLGACSAIVNRNGKQFVCGQPLKGKYASPNAYFCKGHYLQLEEHNDRIRGKKQEPEPEPVIEYEKESDLPF